MSLGSGVTGDASGVEFGPAREGEGEAPAHAETKKTTKKTSARLLMSSVSAPISAYEPLAVGRGLDERGIEILGDFRDLAVLHAKHEGVVVVIGEVVNRLRLTARERDDSLPVGAVGRPLAGRRLGQAKRIGVVRVPGT